MHHSNLYSIGILTIMMFAGTAQIEASCRLTGATSQTGVSGHSATTTTLSTPGTNLRALKSIENLENTGRRDLDRPCRTIAELERLPGVTSISESTSRNFDDCSGNRKGDDIRVEAYDSDIFIRSIKVCTSGQNNESRQRLKGISARFAQVDPDTCQVSNFEFTANDCSDVINQHGIENRICRRQGVSTSTRNNCADWHDLESCPSGQVATGVIVHNRDRGVSGLQLVCRRVTTQ